MYPAITNRPPIRIIPSPRVHCLTAILLVPWLVLHLPLAFSETLEYQIEIFNHLFQPDHLKIPAKQKIRLRIINRDATAEEFESHSLNREKIVPGLAETVVIIGPLDPGEYDFFGEYHPQTAVGKIVVE